jgi:hypothetical protein
VQDALNALRERGDAVLVRDLVIRGAADRLREIENDSADDARRAALRRSLVERLRSGEGLDAAAAYEVRERGWTH